MKKAVGVLISLIMILCMSFTAFAFDVSVFEDNPSYEVSIDPMDDTGFISPNAGLAVYMNTDTANIAAVFDIIVMENVSALRMVLWGLNNYSVRDITSLIIKTEEARYTFSNLSSVQMESGEGLLIVFAVKDSINLLKELATDKEPAMVRLVGAETLDGETSVSDPDALLELYNDYLAAGGTNQPTLEMMASLYPCEIKRESGGFESDVPIDYSSYGVIKAVQQGLNNAGFN